MPEPTNNGPLLVSEVILPAPASPGEGSSIPGSTAPTVATAKSLNHPGRWAATGFIVLVAGLLAKSAITNPNFQWGVVRKYLFNPFIIEGVKLTLFLTVVAQVLGIVLGIVLAIMRLSPNPVLSRSAWGYLWFFRGTPLLVQLIFWYNFSALYPRISISVPFGPTLWSGNVNAIITPFAVAILGLALNEAAYTAEIVRGGIVGVERGQSEAAKALGMTHLKTLRRIVLPQAMKLIVPPLGNQTILMLKTTSLVSTLALADLLYSAQAIYARTYETMPMLIVVSLWYLAITSVLTVGQFYLERYFSAGSAQGQPVGLLTRLGRNLGMIRRDKPVVTNG
jgi:polar amino acid transport system permease protein